MNFERGILRAVMSLSAASPAPCPAWQGLGCPGWAVPLGTVTVSLPDQQPASLLNICLLTEMAKPL